jgi:hypothetical protein
MTDTSERPPCEAAERLELAGDEHPQSTAEVGQALDFLGFLFDGQPDGWVHLAAGHAPFVTETGRVEFDRWEETALVWPRQRDAIAAWLAERSGLDLYFTPELSENPVRTAKKRKCREHRWVRTDLDHDREVPLLGELLADGGLLLSSGRPGNRHAYVRLCRPVDAQVGVDFNRRLTEAVDGDQAPTFDGGYLRLPCGLNSKRHTLGQVTEPDRPAVLEFFAGPGVDPDRLLELLPDLPEVESVEVDVDEADVALPDDLPDEVAKVAEQKPGTDRSGQLWRLVHVCLEHGLTDGQVLAVARTHKPSKAKYGDKLDAEVLRALSRAKAARRKAEQELYDLASGIGTDEATESSVALAECVATFRRWLYLPDPAPLYGVLATFVGNHLDGDPLWLLIVGPPSSGKTEVLNCVSRRAGVHPAATLTEPALLSGTPAREAKGAKGGLLRVIGPFGILLLKDFTSVLAQNKDTRSQVLGALREVYDGSWTRHLGTDGGKTLHWEGKVGLLGGCTPTIDRHHSVLAALGDRFLLLRLPTVDPDEVSRQALAHLGHEPRMRAELAQAADRVLDAADRSRATRALDTAEDRRLKDLAIFAVRARSAVERDGYNQEVLTIPEPEGPARFLLSLRRLMGGLEAIGCTPAEVWNVLGRVAIDSMPATRRRLLEELVASDKERGTADLGTATDLPTSTAKRHLEDLALLGLADRRKKGTSEMAPDLWVASTFARNRWPASPESQGAESSSSTASPESQGAESSGDAHTSACYSSDNTSDGKSGEAVDVDADELCEGCGERPADGLCDECRADLADEEPLF